MNKHKIKQGVELQHNSIPFPTAKGYQVHNDDKIFLYGPIESAFDFVEAIETLSKCEQGDTVTIYLCSPGGCVSSVDALLHAIKSAQDKGVTVHCSASGLCASASTFILLECTSFELSDGFHALIHNGSLGDGGSYNQFRASTNFYLKYMEERLREVYKHFLTDDELQEVLDGRDIWLSPQDWIERYQLRNEVYLQEQECSESEHCDEQHDNEKFNPLPLAQALGYNK